MTSHMSIEELKKLKRGDTVVIKGTEHVIKTKGSKWIYLEGLNRPIDLSTGHLKSSYRREHIYRSMAIYMYMRNEMQQRQRFIEELKSLISYGCSDELRYELMQVILRHKGMPK